MRRTLTATACALALALTAATGCGDALTDGDWPGLPTLILRGAIHAVDPPEWGGALAPALIWAPLTAPGEDFLAQPVRFASADFAAFEAQVHGTPARDALEPFTVAGEAPDDAPRVAVALFVVLEEDGHGARTSGDDLRAAARGVAADHYLIYVEGAERLRSRVGAHILNPIALRDGYNLALGLCRPGRPSQLLIVPDERVDVVARSEATVGACLDVYWGDWRTP